jgi:hypothetical protein
MQNMQKKSLMQHMGRLREMDKTINRATLLFELDRMIKRLDDICNDNIKDARKFEERNALIAIFSRKYGIEEVRDIVRLGII